MVVMMKPDGSLFPGMMNFATTPAKNPMMMVQMMLIGLLRMFDDEFRRVAAVNDHQACICRRPLAVLVTIVRLARCADEFFQNIELVSLDRIVDLDQGSRRPPKRKGPPERPMVPKA
jgi:hypothetical protein